MAKQAEAERERRAKVIHAEGEYQAAEKLKDAACVLAQEPISFQLRYLSTLTEIGVEQNSTAEDKPGTFVEQIASPNAAPPRR